MAAYLQPIIDAFITIMKANLNNEIQDIDGTLTVLDDDAYLTGLQVMPQRLPFVNVFQNGEAIAEFRETGGTVGITWPVVVLVYAAGRDEEDLHKSLDAYNTAVIRAIVQGSSGGAWCLNNTVDRLFLTNILLEDVIEEQGTIFGAGFTRWDCFRITDPSSE